jgi:hypothetical protein
MIAGSPAKTGFGYSVAEGAVKIDHVQSIKTYDIK